MLDLDALPPGVYALGPLAVLSAVFMSGVSNCLWSRNIGNTSCAWRVEYSPAGRAFAIWGLIYTWTVGTIIAELTAPLSGVPVFGLWTHCLWSFSWFLCALWVPLFDAESPVALGVAAAVITSAAATAVAATWISEQWLADDGVNRLNGVLLGTPIALLGGWLTAAAAINVGIAIKANSPGALGNCVVVPPQGSFESFREYDRRRRTLYREAEARSPATVSIVPTFLATLLGGLAVGAQNPVLMAPLMWAIVNLRAFPSLAYVLTLLVCACAVAGALERVYLF